MKVLKISIVFFVFLLMWKETLNQQIRPQKGLQQRSKSFHDDENANLEQIKHVKVKREKKNVRSEVVNSNVGPQRRSRPLILNLGNKPVKTFMPPRKIIKIKPLLINEKIAASSPKPYISAVLKHNGNNNEKHIIKKESHINQTLEGKVEENEKIVEEVIDTMSIDKSLTTNMNEESNIISEEPEKLTPKTNPKSKNKDSMRKKHKDDEENAQVEKLESIKNENVSENEIKLVEPIPIVTISLDNGITEKLNNKTDEELDNQTNEKLDTQTDEKVTVDVMIEKDFKTENTVPQDDDNLKPRKHPFLDVIKNDLHISCPINGKPDDNKVNESRDDTNEEAIETNASDLNTINELSQTTENNEKQDDVIIKSHSYEEVMEISRSPNDQISYNLNLDQDNTVPASYNNYYEDLSKKYQVPKAELNINNGYSHYNPFAPNEQRIDKIDGTTVVSYNNYFKIPVDYGNNNRNYYPINNNKYGYVPARPSQSVNSNFYNNNRGFGPRTVDTKDRIWRTWKNTEYYSKSNNAPKPISNDEYVNLVNQNNEANTIMNQQRRNAINPYAYYKSQNTVPYL